MTLYHTLLPCFIRDISIIIIIGMTLYHTFLSCFLRDISIIIIMTVPHKKVKKVMCKVIFPQNKLLLHKIFKFYTLFY